MNSIQSRSLQKKKSNAFCLNWTFKISQLLVTDEAMGTLELDSGSTTYYDDYHDRWATAYIMQPFNFFLMHQNLINVLHKSIFVSFLGEGYATGTWVLSASLKKSFDLSGV